MMAKARILRFLLVLALVALAFVCRVGAQEDVEDLGTSDTPRPASGAGAAEEPSDLEFTSEFPGNPFSS
jgi:hypothetical protein